MSGDVTFLYDIPIELVVELGRTRLTVRELAELQEDDVIKLDSLAGQALEMRWLAGSKAACKRLEQALADAMDPQAFFVAKSLEMRQRHQKFENTPYSLEPNCKESPGGLRDLQVVLWVAKAAGLGKSWDELARTGLATALEVRQIKANEALLGLIRSRLHLTAKRREDRLVFDLQTAVAESFGYSNQLPAPGQTRGLKRASEQLMKRYYWAAKAVTQLNQILMLNIEERLKAAQGHTHGPLRPVNARFLDNAGMLEVASDDLYQREPHAILETFCSTKPRWASRACRPARCARSTTRAR